MLSRIQLSTTATTLKKKKKRDNCSCGEHTVPCSLYVRSTLYAPSNSRICTDRCWIIGSIRSCSSSSSTLQRATALRCVHAVCSIFFEVVLFAQSRFLLLLQLPSTDVKRPSCGCLSFFFFFFTVLQCCHHHEKLSGGNHAWSSLVKS